MTGLVCESSVRSILTIQPAVQEYGRKLWIFASSTSGASRTAFFGVTRTVSRRSIGVGAVGVGPGFELEHATMEAAASAQHHRTDRTKVTLAHDGVVPK